MGTHTKNDPIANKETLDQEDKSVLLTALFAVFLAFAILLCILLAAAVILQVTWLLDAERYHHPFGGTDMLVQMYFIFPSVEACLGSSGILLASGSSVIGLRRLGIKGGAPPLGVLTGFLMLGAVALFVFVTLVAPFFGFEQLWIWKAHGV